MLHNDLITEVSRQLGGRFQPQASSIKKRIENLIEVHPLLALGSVFERTNRMCTPERLLGTLRGPQVI